MEHSDKQMTFMGHLKELRFRLIRSFLALMLGFSVAYYFAKDIFRILRGPFDQAYRQVFNEVPQLQNITVLEGFMVYIKVALLAGFFLAFPVILYQILSFVLPALNRKERKIIFPILLVATAFFVGGACFGYFLVFPQSFEFLLSITEGELIAQNIRMQDYFKFASILLLGFGAAFEFPLIVFALVALGIVDSKQLLRSWKGMLVFILALSALLTPADVASMLLMAVPLTVLYFIMCLVCAIVFPTPKKIEAKN